MEWLNYLDVAQVEIKHHVRHQNVAQDPNIDVVLARVVVDGAIGSIDIFLCYERDQ